MAAAMARRASAPMVAPAMTPLLGVVGGGLGVGGRELGVVVVVLRVCFEKKVSSCTSTKPSFGVRVVANPDELWGGGLVDG